MNKSILLIDNKAAAKRNRTRIATGYARDFHDAQNTLANFWQPGTRPPRGLIVAETLRPLSPRAEFARHVPLDT